MANESYLKLVNALYSQENYAEALKTAREGAAQAKKDPAKNGNAIPILLEWEGFCLRKLEDFAGAEQADREMLEASLAAEPKPQKLTAKAYEHLTRDLFNQKKYSDALQTARDGVNYAQKALARDDPTTFLLLEWPGHCLRMLDRYQEAYEADKLCWESAKEVFGEADPRTVKQKRNLDFDAKKTAEAKAGAAAAPLSGRTLRCWQSYQSGFMIETPSATLIFDWYKGVLPQIRRDKPLSIFISHTHADHFNWTILSLAEKYDDVNIFLGYDMSDQDFNRELAKLPERIDESISFFDGWCEQAAAFGKVESLPSTDLGVAFLVKVDGMTLFHGGDLFPWRGCEEDFEAFTEPLKGRHIDYAMLPMDPRFPDAAQRCITRFLDVADITFFTPMHLWEKPQFVGTFAAKNASLCEKMIARNPQNARIHRTIELLKPYTIRFK